MPNSDTLSQGGLPPPRMTDRTRVWRGAAYWAVALLILLLLVRADVSIMAWVGSLGLPGNHPIVTCFRELAEHRVLLALGALILVLDPRRFTIVGHTTFAMLIGFCVMGLGKLMIHRVRPGWVEGDFAALSWTAGWHGLDLALRRAAEASMPSGHSYTAFAIALTLGWFYPRWRVPMVVLACGTAVSRVVERLHWPSDCWAGAMIGYLAAWVSLRTRTLCVPSRWFGRNRPAPACG